MKRLIFIFTMLIFIAITGCSPSGNSKAEYESFPTIESAVKYGKTLSRTC